MAITLNTVKCPQCGAALSVEEGRSQLFCSYCGTKVLITNENEYVYRHIDEAEVKKAETDRLIELKKLEIAEQEKAAARAAAQKKNKVWLIIIAVLGLVFLISIISGSMEGTSFSLIISMFLIFYFLIIRNPQNQDSDDGTSEKARVPVGISGFENKSYISVKSMLKSAGFTNIRCIPLNDLTLGLLKKPNMVESITINGTYIRTGGRRFPRDAEVVISYHSIVGTPLS